MLSQSLFLTFPIQTFFFSLPHFRPNPFSHHTRLLSTAYLAEISFFLSFFTHSTLLLLLPHGVKPCAQAQSQLQRWAHVCMCVCVCAHVCLPFAALLVFRLRFCGRFPKVSLKLAGMSRRRQQKPNITHIS